MSRVWPRWRSSPSTRVTTSRSSRSAPSRIAGPSGQKGSNDLPRAKVGSSRWMSRAVLAVGPGDHLQVFEISAEPDRRTQRAEGVERLAAGEGRILALDVAGGDVAGGGDTEHRTPGHLGGRPPAQPLAEDHRDLPLVLDPLALRRQPPGPARTDQRRPSRLAA